MIHSSQIISDTDVSIRWSPTGSISSFGELEVVSNYSLSLQWQTKEIIPVNTRFEESAKLSLKGSLNFTTLTDRTFEMPEIVWIEIRLLIRQLVNGRWVLNRTGKFLVLNDSQTLRPDGLVEHQYSLSSQRAIAKELVFISSAIIQALSISIGSSSGLEG